MGKTPVTHWPILWPPLTPFGVGTAPCAPEPRNARHGGTQPDIQASSPCPLCEEANQAGHRASTHASSELGRRRRSSSDQPRPVLGQTGCDSQVRQGDHAETEASSPRKKRDGAVSAIRFGPLRLAFPVAIAAVIFAACGSADQASLPTTGASAAVLTATATPSPTASPTPAPTPAPTLKPPIVVPAPAPPKPPPPPPPKNTCGAPANPWGYNFCAGNVIYAVPSDFCSYFPCIKSFWKSTNGYAEECVDGMYSHSGGRPGACSYHSGELRPLYGP